MTNEGGEPTAWPRARRLRFCAAIVMALWVVAACAFVVLGGLQASGEWLSALGVIASALFATSFLLTSAANKREWREIAAIAERDDVVAASRPANRTRWTRDAAAMGGSGPATRRERFLSRPPSAPRR
jgi:hypothetical protein